MKIASYEMELRNAKDDELWPIIEDLIKELICDRYIGQIASLSS